MIAGNLILYIHTPQPHRRKYLYAEIGAIRPEVRKMQQLLLILLVLPLLPQQALNPRL